MPLRVGQKQRITSQRVQQQQQQQNQTSAHALNRCITVLIKIYSLIQKDMFHKFTFKNNIAPRSKWTKLTLLYLYLVATLKYFNY